MDEKEKQTPSLLEPESIGGDIADSGFAFQTNLILCKIPYWLSFEGFSAVIREATGDIEAKFYVPGEGEGIEAVEAKNHSLTPAKFWAEIERFKKMDEGSPGTFRHFTLCCSGISEEIKTVVNALRRLRDSQPFYESSSGVMQHSMEAYKERVRKLGKSDEIADFLYQKVLIESDWYLHSDEKTKGLFQSQLIEHHPMYEDLSVKELNNVYIALHNLVRTHKARPITRLQIEQTIQSAISERNRLTSHPIILFTEIEPSKRERKELHFKWTPFFGGAEREYPSSKEWNEGLMRDLQETRDWIIKNRSTRHILLKDNRRISSAIAIGSVFSAVSGFVVEIDYRGERWATNDHPTAETPLYPLSTEFQKGDDNHLVVTVGIMKDHVMSEVNEYLRQANLSQLSMLHLTSREPILSPKHANVAVEAIKKEIKNTLGVCRTKCIHLFYAGPSHLALFLGHRWNALAPVQCYEWTHTGMYTPTCLI
ncbi:SAVED domain-containing protein [Paenactinomyces guangxiensis]|uniref:SAVED domain-containing protein n=1 Tax=Paenactinomyces guangxiensis TaxID=1490290 RepID=A0A7W2A967_9BACL|nr:SAVED domain-containing protein [Paenactinomyces guangxiensis]MBA4496306.1 SAVED domain-containing protein [Paenactinomyces guangxiensis]MBH8593450.1 SAVED domain-containing protein [Paenactinomyces guangxiensis]